MTKTEQQYAALLTDHRPRVIRSAKEHKRALAIVDRLMQKDRLTASESELLDLWVVLIQNYEELRLPTPKASPAAVLEHLIESTGISQAELARQAGFSRSMVSQVLSGERPISVAAARKLGAYFGLPASSFLPV